MKILQISAWQTYYSVSPRSVVGACGAMAALRPPCSVACDRAESVSFKRLLKGCLLALVFHSRSTMFQSKPFDTYCQGMFPLYCNRQPLCCNKQLLSENKHKKAWRQGVRKKSTDLQKNVVGREIWAIIKIEANVIFGVYWAIYTLCDKYQNRIY